MSASLLTRTPGSPAHRPERLGSLWPESPRECEIHVGAPWDVAAREQAAACRESGVPLLVVTPLAAGALLGPLLLPQAGPCLSCLRTQLDLGALHPALSPPLCLGLSPAGLRPLLGEAARAAALPRLRGRMVRLDPVGRPLVWARVTRFSDCEDCRPADLPAEVYYATQLFKRTERAARAQG
jgi:hypothetical protein